MTNCYWDFMNSEIICQQTTSFHLFTFRFFNTIVAKSERSLIVFYVDLP